MNGEKAHAYSKGICRGGWHLIPGNHSLAKGATAARWRAEAPRGFTNRGRQAESLANSGIIGREGSETRSQTETRMEEGPQAEARAKGRIGRQPQKKTRNFRLIKIWKLWTLWD